jgi:hypothetical protein
LSKADLDLIAADLDIDGFSIERARLRMARGAAPKRDLLTHEARYAVEGHLTLDYCSLFVLYDPEGTH